MQHYYTGYLILHLMEVCCYKLLRVNRTRMHLEHGQVHTAHCGVSGIPLA